MAAPIVDPSWAGTLSCSQCKRERLLGEEFSKKMLDRRKKDAHAKLKCKKCVDAEALKEREAAAAKAKAAAQAAGGEDADGEPVVCGGCQKSLPRTAFSRNQLNKAPGKQRCADCLAAADVDNRSAEAAEADAKLEAARAAARKAERDPSLSAAEKLGALSLEAALEAQKVTGIAPARPGSGRGRGRGRGPPRNPNSVLGRGRGGGRSS